MFDVSTSMTLFGLISIIDKEYLSSGDTRYWIGRVHLLEKRQDFFDVSYCVVCSEVSEPLLHGCLVYRIIAESVMNLPLLVWHR